MYTSSLSKARMTSFEQVVLSLQSISEVFTALHAVDPKEAYEVFIESAFEPIQDLDQLCCLIEIDNEHIFGCLKTANEDINHLNRMLSNTNISDSSLKRNIVNYFTSVKGVLLKVKQFHGFSDLEVPETF